MIRLDREELSKGREGLRWRSNHFVHMMRSMERKDVKGFTHGSKRMKTALATLAKEHAAHG
jgi:hypothetical protein